MPCRPSPDLACRGASQRVCGLFGPTKLAFPFGGNLKGGVPPVRERGDILRRPVLEQLRGQAKSVNMRSAVWRSKAGIGSSKFTLGADGAAAAFAAFEAC